MLKYYTKKQRDIPYYQDGGVDPTSLQFPKPAVNEKRGLSTNDKLSLATTGMNLIGNGLQGISKSDHQYTGEQTAIRGGIKEISKIHPIAGAIVAAADLQDKMLQSIGLGPSNIDKSSAKRAGVKGSASINSVINSIPGLGILGLGMGNVSKANDATALTSQYASAFGSSIMDMNAAKDLSGTRMFNSAKASRFVNDWNRQNDMINSIGFESEMAKQNSAEQLFDQQNYMKYFGYSPRLLNAKNGLKFKELDEAKSILNKPKELETSFIPDGELHAHKHNITKENPELKGKITEKGIPVVSIDENGEIKQQAEVEKEEMILSSTATKGVEDLYDEYKETKSDDIAIECGKFLTQEILKNTDDKSGIIKKVE